MIEINKLINAIIEQIKEEFNPDRTYQVQNFFGKELKDFRDLFKKTNTIYILFDSIHYDIESNNTQNCRLDLNFIIIEPNLTLQSKYLTDYFRDYIHYKTFDFSSYISSDWQVYSIEPCFLEREYLMSLDEESRAIFVFECYINFQLRR